MAQITCPDCANQYADDAPYCPNCGRPNSTRSAAGSTGTGTGTGTGGTTPETPSTGSTTYTAGSTGGPGYGSTGAAGGAYGGTTGAAGGAGYGATGSTGGAGYGGAPGSGGYGEAPAGGAYGAQGGYGQQAGGGYGGQQGGGYGPGGGGGYPGGGGGGYGGHGGHGGPVGGPPQQIPNYLVQAILVTLCCCLPLGIVAIIKSTQVNSKRDAGDIAGAWAASAEAKKWVWIAFGVGIVAQLIWGLVYGFAMIASIAGGGASQY